VNPSNLANSDSPNAVFNDRNTPNYLAQFGFLQAPFSTLVDDNMYYPDPGQKQRLDLVLHLTQFSDDILILTGETGSGKTTLAYQFLQQAHSSWKTCFIAASRTTNASQFLRQFNHCFQLQNDSQILEQMVIETKGRLSDKLSDPGPHILLIDDAHHLNAETLGVLFELADVRDHSEKNQLHLVLLAQPDIKTTMLEPEVAATRHAKTRKLEIPALNRFHSDALLTFRLRVAGCNDRIISDKVLARIFSESQGNPGKLCSAAHEYLSQKALSKFANSATGGKRKMSWMKRTFLLVLALVGIGLLFFQDEFNRYFNQKPDNSKENTVVSQKIELPQKTQPDIGGEAVKSGESETDQAIIVAENKIETPPEAQTPSEEAASADNTRFDHLAAEVPAELEKKRNDALEKIQSQLKKLEKKRREQPASQDPVHPQFAMPATEKPAEKISESPAGPVLFPATGQALASASDSSTSQQTAAEAKNTTKPKAEAIIAKPASNAKESPPNTRPPEKNALSLTHGEQWIEKQPAEYYTLQLIAGYQLSTLQRFITQHKLAQKELSYYLSYNKQGKAWHSLLYGSYPDLQSARNAAQALTQSSSIKQPWIRQFSKIHGDLRPR